MAALAIDVFRSKNFTFVVGENEVEFTLHAAIIAKQSKALDILINGRMEEALNGRAIFGDVQEDTFIRFCQFAYTGRIHYPTLHAYTYHWPSKIVPTNIPNDASARDRDEPLEVEEVPLDMGFGKWGVTPQEVDKPKKLKKPSKSTRVRQSLDNLVYNTEPGHKIITARYEIRQNSSPTEDYTTVFLGHAQLYVFAEKWGIDVLKTLALFKLHKTLTTFTLYAVRRPDIVALLRYAFSNDHTPDLVDTMDELRSLVILYTACEAENLLNCPEFLSLIGEGGQLAQNLIQTIMKRIN